MPEDSFIQSYFQKNVPITSQHFLDVLPNVPFVIVIEEIIIIAIAMAAMMTTL
jgi:hypothetical protein